MGRTILLGVLRMPSAMWHDGTLEVYQRESRYYEAASVIEKQDDEIAQLRRELEEDIRLLTACEATLKYERKRADLNERALELACAEMSTCNEHSYQMTPDCFRKLAQEQKDTPGNAA